MSMQSTRKNNVSIILSIIDTLFERVHAMDMRIIGPLGSGLIVSLKTFASIATNTGRRILEFNHV